MSDKIEALERLARLAEDGRITEEEYGILKRELLDQDNQPNPMHPGWYPDEKPGLEHYWDGRRWAGLTRPAQRTVREVSRSDKYKEALAKGMEPAEKGWYPDPDQLGTHTRFFNGSEWTDLVRERRPPDWYPVEATSGFGVYSGHRERYFDGLKFTDEYRTSRSRGSELSKGFYTPLAWRDIKERQKDWRFWVGLFLIALGFLAVAAALYRFNNERVQTVTVLMLNVVLDPYIWAGVGGLALLRRWKRNTDPSRS